MKYHFISRAAAFNTVGVLSTRVTSLNKYIMAPTLSQTPVFVRGVCDGVGS